MGLLQDKSALQSWSVWGGAVLALSQFFENSGVLVPGTSVSLAQAAAAVGSFLAIVGFRRKLGEAATK